MYATHAYVINESFYDRVLGLRYDMGIIDTIYMAMYTNNYYMAKELLAWQDDEFERKSGCAMHKVIFNIVCVCVCVCVCE